jgi:hypothetical protein
MSRGTLTTLLAVLAVIALAVGGFFALFERKETTTSAPDRGEARYNRFFALEHSLNALDVPARSVNSLSEQRVPLKAGDTLVLGEGLERIDVDAAARVAGWVRNGGHLVLAPGWADAAAHTPLLEALDVLQPKRFDESCVELDTELPKTAPNAGERSFTFCGPRFLPKSEDAPDGWIGDRQKGYAYARVSVGDGEVSLLASVEPLSYRELQHTAQQRFAWRVLAPLGDDGKVYLLYALDGPSLWVSLFTRGWPALLALGVLLAGWMAMRSERLGPLMPAPSLQRRALLEHVQAVGEFVYRRDGGLSLHGLASRTVLERLRRHDPLSAALEGEALYQRLAERYGVDPAQLARAFQVPANAAAFRESIATLARLRSRP